MSCNRDNVLKWWRYHHDARRHLCRVNHINSRRRGRLNKRKYRRFNMANIARPFTSFRVALALMKIFLK